jgi:hypothetical protein
MEVGPDLKNVYVWADARKMLPLLANHLMLTGSKGRKFEKVSLGDAASMAILEACKSRGLEMTPAMIGGEKVTPVPVVKVKGKVGLGTARPAVAK